MGYSLGVDVGTTWTAAATCRGASPEIVNLGNRGAAVPTVIYVRPDGELLVGDAAVRRAAAEPERVAREFKRRLGDPTPLLLGGTPWSAETLTAKMLRWVVDTVAGLEGGPPDTVCVTHPANWGPYKRELLEGAIRQANLDGAVLLSEPEAAAVSYAATERVAPGDVVLVYDLGGGTFDAAVLRKSADGFEILGQPEGIEHLGGLDIDEAVFGHVATYTDGALERGDPADAAFVADVTRLRQECVDAKEALSSDTETSIPVVLPSLRTEVRLSRPELEAMIRAPLSETLAALRRAMRSASVEAADVTRVLLVGGSSRIPMVAEMVGAELRRPVAVDAHPKHAIALGAALHAAATAAPAAPTPVAPPPAAPPPVAPPPVAPPPAAAPPVAAPPAAAPPVAPPPAAAPPVAPPVAPPPAAAPPVALPPAAPPTAPPPTAPPPAAPTTPPPSAPAAPPPASPTPGAPARSRTPIIVAAVVVVLLVVGGVAFALTRGSDDGTETIVAATTCPPDDRPSVCIVGVTNDGGEIAAEFQRQGGVELEASEDAPHARFFFDDDPTTTQIWGNDSPFQWQGTVDVTSSRQLCVVVVDVGGEEFPNSGNCADVPTS